MSKTSRELLDYLDAERRARKELQRQRQDLKHTISLRLDDLRELRDSNRRLKAKNAELEAKQVYYARCLELVKSCEAWLEGALSDQGLTRAIRTWQGRDYREG